MVKVAVAGLGGLGRKRAEHIIQHVPEAELIAVCSRRQSVVDEFSRENAVPKAYTDYDEMLTDREIDAVVISTAVGAHHEMVLKAIDKGFHVLVEKPIALTTEQAIAVQHAVEARPELVFMTGYMRRFDTSYAEAKRIIDSGGIGRPFLFRGYSLDRDSGSESAPERGEENGVWYSEMLVHDVDLIRWLLGVEVLNVRTIGGCYKHREFEKYQDVDNACTLMECENGAMAMLYTGRTAPHGSHVESEVVGTEGMLRINPIPGRDKITSYQTEGAVVACVPDYLERFEDAFISEMREFVSCVASGRKPEITAFDARRVSEIANLAHEAYLSGAIISCGPG